MPFLTPDTTEVLPFVYANASVGFVTVMRTWQVLPIELDGQWVGWEWLIYMALVGGAFGTAIGAIVQLVTLVRIAVGQQR